MELIPARKAVPGDKVAVVAPSFAAPAVYPAVHEQAMQRLRDEFGLVPVEYPTTRGLNPSPEARAADLNAAFADPEIRAILAVVGGEDQITVVPHLDPELIRADPKPYFGYSDNTNILNWLLTHGVAGYYGGSTQVHLGAGPGIDAIHRASLSAALFTGERLELTEPGESEDIGVDWADPAALASYGSRGTTEPWIWAGAAREVSGRTWGGCAEVIQWIATAGRMPAIADLAGGILLLETSEELIPAREFGWIVRGLGERGLLDAVAGIVIARPPASDHARPGTVESRAAHRAEQADEALRQIGRYNPDAVICIGVPFGHTRPQWIVPYGGRMTLDGTACRVWADYA